MATLERQITGTTTASNTPTAVLAGPIPTPFDTREKSRSPSASRVMGVLGKVRNAISRSRDRSAGERSGSQDRRGSVGSGLTGNDDRGRGRSGERREAIITEEDHVTYPPRGRTLSPSSVRFSSLTTTKTNMTTKTTDTRASSRGRVFQSSGRGGAGNMKTGSAPLVDEEPEVVQRARDESKQRSRSRGREEVVVAGRGGRGNIVSPERSGETEEERQAQLAEERKKEAEVIEQVRVREAEAPKKVWVSGRGGAGNISVGKAAVLARTASAV